MANEKRPLLAEYDRVHIGPPGGARKLMEDAPAVQQWISVKDRLPTEEDASNGGYVFAYNTNNKVIIATYQDVVRFSDFVKYWTHLPQPPKGE